MCCHNCRQPFDIPPYSYRNSNRQAPLVLFCSDWATTAAEPMSPHLVSIGPITAAPAQALPPDLEEFVQLAGEHGVAYASLGTTAIPGKQRWICSIKLGAASYALQVYLMHSMCMTCHEKIAIGLEHLSLMLHSLTV